MIFGEKFRKKYALSEAGETDREGLLNICGYGEE